MHILAKKDFKEKIQMTIIKKLNNTKTVETIKEVFRGVVRNRVLKIERFQKEKTANKDLLISKTKLGTKASKI